MQTTEVTLWLCDDRAVQTPRLLDTYEDWLSDAERERRARFRFAAHRHQFLVSRALLRWVLGRYTGLEPASLRFGCNAWGKPHLELGGRRAPVFNLSHTDGLIVLAVAEAADGQAEPPMLGVDVERMDRVVDAPALARRFFSALESDTLHGLPVENQQPCFFDYWTLKEAYIKAVGMGLGIPLADFSFTLQADRIDIRFTASRSGDDPSAWQFRRLFYQEGGQEKGQEAATEAAAHQLAVALGGGGPLQLSVMRGAPLTGFEMTGLRESALPRRAP